MTDSEANITRGSQVLSLHIKSSHDDEVVHTLCLHTGCFLASQDALEVMRVTYLLTHSALALTLLM